jgi:hypothetical protein
VVLPLVSALSGTVCRLSSSKTTMANKRDRECLDEFTYRENPVQRLKADELVISVDIRQQRDFICPLAGQTTGNSEDANDDGSSRHSRAEERKKPDHASHIGCLPAASDRPAEAPLQQRDWCIPEPPHAGREGISCAGLSWCRHRVLVREVDEGNCRLRAGTAYLRMDPVLH